jgi:hypothetical protein
MSPERAKYGSVHRADGWLAMVGRPGPSRPRWLSSSCQRAARCAASRRVSTLSEMHFLSAPQRPWPPLSWAPRPLQSPMTGSMSSASRANRAVYGRLRKNGRRHLASDPFSYCYEGETGAGAFAV